MGTSICEVDGWLWAKQQKLLHCILFAHMKNFKKLFSMAAIVAIVGTFAPVATLGAATYSEELEGAYGYAYDNGITTMSSIDNADMYGSLTRIAMAKMMANYAIEVLGQTPDTTKECSFPDVASALDEQYDNGVTKACQLGLMGVGIDNFNPNGLVTRAEFGTVLSRALYGDANNGGTPYYADHLAALKDAGIMNNIDTPTQLEVRGYVMLMMQRADTTPAICELPENVLACSLELDTCPAECKDIEVLPGFATVSLVGSASTQSVPRNGQLLKVGSIRLTAGQNDTTVSSVVITRSGLWEVSDVQGFQLTKSSNWVAATAVSSRPSSSTQSSTLRFSPSLVLKAGASETFDVLVNLSGADNNEHTFAVTAINVVNGTAAGTPVMLGTLRTTSYNAGDIVLSNATPASIIAGKKDQLLATVDLYPSSKDGIIKGFTITKEGGSEDFTKVMSNVKAYYNGSMVGNVIVDAEKITVSNLNVERLNGETANIELKGDGVYIGTKTALTGYILPEHVSAVEKTTGFPMYGKLTAGARQNVVFGLSTIDISLTKVTTGSKTVAPATSSVELFNAKITSDATFDVSSFTVSIDTGVLASGFIDGKVTLYVDGVDYEFTANKTYDTSSDKFRVEPGHTVYVKIIGNVKSMATVPMDYRFKLKLNSLKNIDNGDVIDITTTNVKEILGDTVKVNNGTYTVTKPTSIPNNKTVLEGSASDVLYFNMKASAENQVLTAVVIESLVVPFSGYASSVSLMQGNTAVKTITDETKLWTVVTFDNLSTTLTKDTTVPFTVRVVLKAGEVENLGETIQVRVNSTNVRRSSSNVATNGSAVVLGNQYQIASNIPTVALPSQDGKNTIISFVSTSNYDVEVITGSLEMTRNLNNGTFVNWSGSWKLLDSINGAAAGLVVGTNSIPGPITFSFSGNSLSGFLLVDNTAVERVIELVDSANTVTDADYTVTVKNVTFRYRDRSEPAKMSKVITESYNVSK